MAAIDPGAYFRRVGYDGPAAPTLDTLRALHLAHVGAIPFENLDPLLGRPVRLDLPSVERKLVRGGRGGYCFEQNGLFRAVLEAVGFPVVGLAARVLWNVPDGRVPALAHMVLRVEVDGRPYLADVGFGGMTLTGPIRLEADTLQETPHEPFRLTPDGGEFVLRALVRGEWRPLYRFDLTERPPIDYEVANWYVSTHPESIFVNGVLAGRALPGRRATLRGNELATHGPEGTDRRALTTPAELRGALAGVFGLSLPDGPDLEAALARSLTRAGSVV
ncbi:MAG: arylamine N-acetyltransferase [Gemmataceae bacterium]|nr:arylamine N-acetyltransferase [Gemmataceae bacterium]